MRKSEIKKAVIAVAGFGTRFLPATKAQPKAMLPVVDKPVVQYLVEEAVEAGIKEIIFVINSNQHVLGEHFSRDIELERLLRAKKKKDLLEKVKNIHKSAEFFYVHQNEPLGSGNAIMRARSLLGKEPFAILFADDLFAPPPGKPVIGQLVEAHNKYGGTVLGLARVSRENSRLYGMVKGKKAGERMLKIDALIEKPEPAKAPSLFASVGRYIIDPKIFELIPKVKKVKGEINLPFALARLAEQDGEVYGYEIEGTWYDCGSKIGFWKANLEFGLEHPEIGGEAKKYLR